MKKVLSIASLRSIFPVRCVAVMLLLVTAWGCGGSRTGDPTAGQGEDQKAISNLVYSLADGARSLDTFRALYAKDKAPSATEAAKYKGYMFFVRSDITVTGDTASFTAGMEKPDSPLVEKPWTAVKEGGEWKLADTPLP
jgi:hypothetical protein